MTFLAAKKFKAQLNSFYHLLPCINFLLHCATFKLHSFLPMRMNKFFNVFYKTQIAQANIKQNLEKEKTK